MNPQAFNEFIAHIRWLGLPGGEIIIGLAAVAAGFALVRAEDGELQAVPSMTRRRWAAVAVVGVVGAALLFAAPADADPYVAPQIANYAQIAAPAICSTLDEFPSLPGVSGVLAGIENDSGFTNYQAGQVIVLAVQARCVRHLPLLQRFADTWNGPAYTGGTTV